MSLYQPGDVVRIVKPTDLNEFPMWNPEMNQYERTVVIIDRVNPLCLPDDRGNGVQTYCVESNSWSWRESWLVPYDGDGFTTASDSEILSILGMDGDIP